jgi:Peptidase A4 family
MQSKLFRQIVGRLILAGLSFAFAFCGGSSLVMAGGAPPAESLATDQAVAQAVVKYPQPPANFHPLSASDAELERHGFPPRPDAIRARTPYEHWKKLVSVPRVANPILQQTTIYNGPVQHLLTGQTLRNGIVSTTSTNWSGYAVIGASGTFTSNNSFVFAEWVVPRAQQGFGVCDGFWDYSSQWDGFDGVTSNDVLQAGTEADAYCSGSTQATFYSSWIEWYPFSETRVSIPVARPGDLMSSEVWYTTTPPFGHVYIVNFTLQQGQVYAFNPPSGTTFAGDSAEWIEERPGISTGLANLTNYAADQFNVDYAYNTLNYFYPRTSPAGTTTYAISMSCPPWTPSSSCPSTTVISVPERYGSWALWFYDSPPAL